MEQAKLAGKVIIALTSFLAEFEEMHTRPNMIFLTIEQKEALEVYFPYYFTADGKFMYNKFEYDIVITDKNVLGAAFSLYTNYVEEY
jgi:hypothetical protein